MPIKAYYNAPVCQFLNDDPDRILGVLTSEHHHALEEQQRWVVGGGQGINTGEPGISEWMSALETRFPEWEAHVSPRISLPKYGSHLKVEAFLALPRVCLDEHLLLSVSMRSFRAERLSEFVGHILDNDPEGAKGCLQRHTSGIPDISDSRS
jgi:hypothetical protein